MTKIKKRTRLTAAGKVLWILGSVLKYIAPFLIALSGYFYIIDSWTAGVSYTVIIILAGLLVSIKAYTKKKIESLRNETMNYKTELNLSSGDRLKRAEAFYKQDSLLLNILDNAAYVLVLGLFAVVCTVAEKGLAKLALLFSLCFISVAIGAVLSIIGRTKIKGAEENES